MNSGRNPKFNVIVLAILFACLTLGVGAQPTSSPGVREPPAGEGVICSWAIVTALAEVKDTCFPDKNPALQAELRRSVARIDQYVLRNSKTMTSARMAEFKRQQGHVGAPASQVYIADAIQLNRSVEKAGAAKLLSGIDTLLTRDGEPTWGTCF